MTSSAIIERYSQETAAEHCGCANLWPFLNILSGMSILDLGSGNGAQTYLFAKAALPGLVIGLDITDEMLTFAKANYALPNLSFMAGDISAIPLPNERIDLVTSNCVINHAPDKSKVYSEIFRVLRPGGQFLISDVCALDTISAEEACDPKKVAECWAGALPREEYIENVMCNGFESVEVLSAREYFKAGHRLESLIIKGVKR